MQPNEGDIKDQDIGTEDDPKVINLSKRLLVDEKKKYIELMKKYSDVFSLSYEDLKEYDTSIIQHTIPVKPGEKTFQEEN